MTRILILCLALTCLICSVFCSEYLHHDYDIQIHPIHGHHGYDEHGYATSIRYDKRYHHKVPDYGHHDDVVYQYVSDGDHHDEEGYYY